MHSLKMSFEMDSQGKKFLLWCQDEKKYAKLAALLEESDWQCIQLGADLNTLSKCDVQHSVVCLAILEPINKIFDEIELDKIANFIESGGSMIIASSEDEGHTNRCNLNRVIAPFEIAFNRDCVIRPNVYKLYHPKEAMMEDFIVNRGLQDALTRLSEPTDKDSTPESNPIGDGARRHRLLYPRGCTMKVGKSSTIMMTSSKWTVPNQQAICAFHRVADGSKGRVIAIGSGAMFSDFYIDLEDNENLIRSLLDFIVNKNFPINISDAKTVEIPDPVYGPDIFKLMDTPMPCLQTSGGLPDDKSSLAYTKLFSLDNRMLPKIVEAHKVLGIAYEPLTLIKPDLALRFIRPEPAIHGFRLSR